MVEELGPPRSPGRSQANSYQYSCTSLFRKLDEAFSGYEELVDLVSREINGLVEPETSFGKTVKKVVIRSNRLPGVSFKVFLEKDVQFEKNSNHFMVSVSLTVDVQPGSRPTVGLVSSETLNAVLQRVVSAAGEGIPFQSLRGESNTDRASWKATASLPGATTCTVGVIVTTGRPIYSCLWVRRDIGEAQGVFENMVHFLEQNADWKSRPMQEAGAASGVTQQATFHTDNAFGADFGLQLRDKLVFVLISPGRAPSSQPTGTDTTLLSNSVSLKNKSASRNTWGSGIERASFTQPIGQLLTAASEEREPFESLKGEATGTGPAVWRATVTLPGAEHCVIEQNQHETLLDRWVGKFYYYICESTYDSPEEAKRGYDEAISLLTLPTSWHSSVQQPSGTEIEKRMVKSDTEKRPLFYVALEKNRSVVLEMFPDFTTRTTANISADSVKSSLRQISASATERIPFGSITGEKDGKDDRWRTTTAIPGGSSCVIILLSTTKRPVYGCTLEPWPGISAEGFFDKFVELILELGDWLPTKREQPSGAMKSAQFSALTGPSLSVQLTRDGNLSLLIFASR